MNVKHVLWVLGLYIIVVHQTLAGSKNKRPRIIVVNLPAEPEYEYPTFQAPPPYIVWNNDIYDDVIPYNPDFYEPYVPPPIHSWHIINHLDDQEKEDEDYEKLNKNITRPSLEAFKRTWIDPYSEHPMGQDDCMDHKYFEILNELSLEKSGLIPYHYMDIGNLRFGPHFHQRNYGGHFGGYYGGHLARYRYKRAIQKGTSGASVSAAVIKTKSVRKEYRTLTEAERKRFHKAVRTLKSSGAYDVLGKRHKLALAPGAHFGSAFLLFHRYYILQFEIALQLIDPKVSLPYWDSALDSRLGLRFRETCLFDSHSLGQWKGGPVTDGAFANFTAYKGCKKSGKMLTRKVAANTLYTSGDYNFYESLRYFEELAGNSKFEDDHGYVHVAMGGHMANLNCAPVDPLFFMHHAFVDYLWWKFRKTQIGDITKEYVNNPLKHHLLDDPMKPFKGVKNRDGLKLMTSITYEESPSMKRCSKHTDCRSKMLWCDRGRCTAKVRIGSWCHRKNPSSCYCEHGIPSCAGKKTWMRQHMRCVCSHPHNPTNEGNMLTPAKHLTKGAKRKAAARNVKKNQTVGRRVLQNRWNSQPVGRRVPQNGWNSQPVWRRVPQNRRNSQSVWGRVPQWGQW